MNFCFIISVSHVYECTFTNYVLAPYLFVMRVCVWELEYIACARITYVQYDVAFTRDIKIVKTDTESLRYTYCHSGTCLGVVWFHAYMLTKFRLRISHVKQLKKAGERAITDFFLEAEGGRLLFIFYFSYVFLFFVFGSIVFWYTTRSVSCAATVLFLMLYILDMKVNWYTNKRHP